MPAQKMRWTDVPAAKDFDAATTYLALLLPNQQIDEVINRLRKVTTTYHKPKDLERASGLRLLPPDDPEVAKKPQKSRNQKPLTPALLVRGSLESGRPLIIADGYHRICAGYHVDRDAAVPCRLVDVD